MAEVTKKTPIFSSNSFVSSSSSSSKHTYDDVFASRPSSKLKSSLFGDDDFAEIFGSSKSEDSGLWESSFSSIPVLSIPDSDHRSGGSRGRGGGSGGGVDYLGVFGGGIDEKLALPDGEELFDQLKKKAKTLASVSVPRSKEQTTEAIGSHVSRQSENGLTPSKGFSQSFDDEKHFKHEDEMPTIAPNDATHVAHVHAIPESSYPLHDVGSSQKTQSSSRPTIKEDTVNGNSVYLAKEGKHSRSTSSERGANEQTREHDACFLKASRLSESISVASSHETHQVSSLSKLVKDGAKVQFDATVATPASSSVHEVGPSQRTQTNRTPIIEENAEIDVDIHPEEKKRERSRKTSSELGSKELKVDKDAIFQRASSSNDSNSVAATRDKCQAKVERDVKHDPIDAGASDLVANKQSGEEDADFRKAPDLNGSNQDATSHDTQQEATIVGGSSKVVKDDDAMVAPVFDVGKKQSRHSRMTSLDISDSNKQDAGFQRKSRFGSSYSFDASHDPFAARIKVHPSKVMPSSSLPQFFPVENYCKISENSSFKNSEKSQYRGAGGSPPSLDEQLDANSLAALSAAALQRAIEEAEMRIRSAKEFLEREGHGITKLTFKDTLKLSVGKENNNVNGINGYRQMRAQEHRPQVDSRLKTSYRTASKSVSETDQVAQVFEGQKTSPKDEEAIAGKNAKASKPVEEGDKHDGGEWEAAKHLNQLISGVKNRIASFMTWQAETEKKEEPKETESSSKSLQQSSGEWEPKGAEVFEIKETEKNQCASIFDYTNRSWENKKGLISEAIEAERNESMKRNAVVQEKADDKVDMVPNNEGLTKTNFLFFTFSSERSWDPTHAEGEKKNRDSGELGYEDTRKEERDEVYDEHILGKSEDTDHKGLDDIYVSQYYGESLQASSNGESDELVEEPYPVAEYDRSELTCDKESDIGLNAESPNGRRGFSHENNPGSRLSEEYGDDRSLNEECGDDVTEFTDEDDRKVTEGCGNNGSEFTHQENERLSEESEDNKSGFTHEENRRRSEEWEGAQSHFTHEENDDGRQSEECGGDQSNFIHEENNDTRLNEECEDELINSSHCPRTIIMTINTDDEREESIVVEEVENQLDNGELLQEADLVGETGKGVEAIGQTYERQESVRDYDSINNSEGVVQRKNGWEENKRNQNQPNHTEETENKVAEEVGCIVTDDECKQTGKRFLSESEEACVMDESKSGIRETVLPDEKCERMMEVSDSSSDLEMDNPSSDPKNDVEFTQVSNESVGKERVSTSASNKNMTNFHGIVHLDGTDETLPRENFVLHKSKSDLNLEQKDVDVRGMEPNSEDIKEDLTEHFNEFVETVDMGEAASVSDNVTDNCSSEAVHRRRRWFENQEKVGAADLPNILEGDGTNLEVDQEVLEESELAGCVEIHADKMESETSEVSNPSESAGGLDQESKGVNSEGTQKRRRWFVHRGGEGIPEPPSLFKGVVGTSEMDPKIVNESLPDVLTDGFVDHAHTEFVDTLNVVEAEVLVNEETSKQSIEATPRRKRWFESGDKVGPSQQQRSEEDARTSVDMNQEHNERGDTDKSEEGKDDVHIKTEPVNEVRRDLDAVNRRKKEKEKERIAVERAIREARERAFAEARERARRDAVEKPKMEGSQRVGGSGVQERPGKASGEVSSASDKASNSMEAKLRAERAAVERATAEARERALQKALSEKASHRSRESAGRHQPERNSSIDPKYHSSSSYTKSSDPSSKGEKFDGADGESVQRRKARLERQKRTMERAARALEEKNTRDLLAQKEQAARNIFADSLDAEVKRWSSGKEGNLRALLSTLQYILGSDSGWQAVSLTDLMAPTAVRKAYKKATLCVHPDKLQQRGATIQQKYICEKVFDLLKEAWSKFNPDER